MFKFSVKDMLELGIHPSDPIMTNEEYETLVNAMFSSKSRCHKCVYETQCSRDKDYFGTCPKYKRDAPDGGYYG